MALVRVYCGISSAVDPDAVGTSARLTVAVVDDSGRLLEYCDINDDPAGYAAVTSFLAERFGGSTLITVAVDSDEHLMVSLLAASGRLIAFTDDDTADDLAERFGDDDSPEEINAADAQRRAVGLARGLQAGVLSAGVTAAPREFAALRPVLAAHAALAVGRHAAAVALREVLRELYPAALRAYPDPAAPVALAMLDALPEPGLLTAASGRGRDAAVTVAARLVADGICGNDTALEAVTALRVAITETPRRNGISKQLTAAVCDAVRASVAAVRSADDATNVLIQAMTDRVAPNIPTTKTASRRRAPTPITTLAAQPHPVAPPPRAPAPVSAAPAAPAPVSPAPVHVTAAANAAAPPNGRPAWNQSTPPPTPPGFEPTPVTGTPAVPRPAAVPAQRMHAQEPLAPFVPTLTNAAINNERASRGLTPPQAAPPREERAAPPREERIAPPREERIAPPREERIAPPREERVAEPLPSRANWPLVGEPDEQTPAGHDDQRIKPPWQADDLVLPSLRLVEPVEVTSIPTPLKLVEDPLNTPSALDEPSGSIRMPKPRRSERAGAPQNAADDTDLLIFASVSSAWFSGEDEGETTWNSAMDIGWRAAEEASLRPSIAGDTNAGLPQRVPQANLVPGAPAAQDNRPLRIVRDAGEIAAHTSSYFRGWRKGTQEAGGYSVGGRPGRESASGWDFNREHEMRDDRGDYGQRAVNYR